MNSRPSRNKLPERTYVSLSEALTWIAFGEALEAQDLKAQVEGERPIDADGPQARLRKLNAGELRGLSQQHGVGFFHDRDAGLERLRKAWHKLREAVSGGIFGVRGRFTSTYSTRDARLADITDLKGADLATFSQFDVSTGGIRRQTEGSPDILWANHDESFERELESFQGDPRAADGYLFVEVETSSLANTRPLIQPSSAPNNPRPKALPQAMLDRWWNNLTDLERLSSIDRVLVPLCRKAFPDYKISRERIRALAPGRKRGRKPFRGDSSAQ